MILRKVFFVVVCLFCFFSYLLFSFIYICTLSSQLNIYLLFFLIIILHTVLRVTRPGLGIQRPLGTMSCRAPYTHVHNQGFKLWVTIC